MFKLVCSATEDYMDRIKPYLQTVNAFSRAENVLVTVDFKPTREYFADLPDIKWVSISAEQNRGAPEGTHSIQHGSFVQLVAGEDDDVLIYTDGDIIMQRQMTQAEQGFLEYLPADMVCISWNSGPDEKLIHEALRLSPTTGPTGLVEAWGEMIEMEPCFNIGVMAARASTWRRIYERYMELWPKACETFHHRARQQWLVCYVMAELKLNRWVMPYSWHTHEHYGLPPGLVLYAGVAIYQDRVILFRHRF